MRGMAAKRRRRDSLHTIPYCAIEECKGPFLVAGGAQCSTQSIGERNAQPDRPRSAMLNSRPTVLGRAADTQGDKSAQPVPSLRGPLRYVATFNNSLSRNSCDPG